jgi:hypothetical protein
MKIGVGACAPTDTETTTRPALVGGRETTYVAVARSPGSTAPANGSARGSSVKRLPGTPASPYRLTTVSARVNASSPSLVTARVMARAGPEISPRPLACASTRSIASTTTVTAGAIWAISPASTGGRWSVPDSISSTSAGRSAAGVPAPGAGASPVGRSGLGVGSGLGTGDDGADGGADGGSQRVWTINDRVFDPTRMDAVVRPGQVERWRFGTDLHHPVHVHLAAFQVLSRGGHGPGPTDGGWKDTVDVRPAEHVDVLVRFPDLPGRYVLHCHNLEHEDMMMMSAFEVRA